MRRFYCGLFIVAVLFITMALQKSNAQKRNEPQIPSHKEHLLTTARFSIQGKRANDSCVTSPSDPSCKDYKLPNVQTDVNMMCSMMSNMAGCTVDTLCKKKGHSLQKYNTYCDPFSVLKDLCTDMSGMSPCNNYTSMCAAGSVVEQCQTKALALPSSMEISNYITDMCHSMRMEDCSKCDLKRAMLNCNLLSVYSDLCKSMPDMPQCKSWHTLCRDVPDWPICSGSGDGDDEQPIMRMYFHTGYVDYVLFKGWVPRNGWEYALTWIAILSLGIFYEALKAMRSVCEAKWSARRSSSSSTGSFSIASSSEEDDHHHVVNDGRHHVGHRHDASPATGSSWKSMPPFRWTVEVPRACLVFGEVMVGLLLMLVAMTFNVGLFFAVCAGAFVGSLAFGRFISYSAQPGCH